MQALDTEPITYKLIAQRIKPSFAYRRNQYCDIAVNAPFTTTPKVRGSRLEPASLGGWLAQWQDIVLLAGGPGLKSRCIPHPFSEGITKTTVEHYCVFTFPVLHVFHNVCERFNPGSCTVRSNNISMQRKTFKFTSSCIGLMTRIEPNLLMYIIYT